MVAWRDAWTSMLIAGAVTAWMVLGHGVVQLALATVWFLIAKGALWRLATGASRPGPGGLQVGKVELRLAAIWALSLAFLGVLAILLFVVLLCCAYAVAATGRGFDPANVTTWARAVTDRGRAVVSAVAVLGAAGMTLCAARISLAEAASVARNKVQVLSTWTLSRGRVLPIVLGNLMIATLPAAAILCRPAGVGSASAALWAFGEGFVIAGVWLPMSVGLMAYIHRSCIAQKPI